MAQNSNKKTKFVKSKSVVTDDFLNSIYGGLKGTEMESVLGTTDPLIGGHVHDGVSADGHAQKINLAEHVTGKLPLSMISGTITASAADPEYSIQFNQSSLLAGSESFIFNTADNSPVLKQGSYLYFGTADSGTTSVNHIRLTYSTVDSAKALVFSRNASDSSDPSLSILMDDFRTLAIYPLNQTSTNNFLGVALKPWSSAYLNKLVFTNYNNDASSNTISFQVTNGISETQTLNLPSTRPAVNQYLKAETVLGSTVNLTWDTVSASATPGTPTNSFQFNSADTSFSGTETFYFEPSTRDIVFAKDHKWWFGSTDSTNSFWIEHEVDGTTPVLEFYAANSVDSNFAFTNGASGTTDVIVKIENGISYLYPTGSGFLGRDSSGDLFKWNSVIADGLSLYHNDTTADTYITLNANGNEETYNLELPKLRPTTVDMVMKVVQYGATTELTWDTPSSTVDASFITAPIGTIDTFQSYQIMTNSISGNTVDFGFASLDTANIASTLDVGTLTISGQYTLPSVDGATNYILKTNGSGVVSWTVDSSGISNLVEDTTPELGGQLVTGGNKISFASGNGTSELNFQHTWGSPGGTEANHTYLATVKSFDLYLDMNGGDSGQAFRIYNNIDPSSVSIYPNDSNYIWKLHEDGTMYMTNNIVLSSNDNVQIGSETITETKVGQWDTAYSWGDHSLQGYLTTDTTVSAGTGLTKTGNTIDLDSNQSFGTVDIDYLSINSAYTLPSVDGSAGYILVTDGLGGVSWTEQDSFTGGDNIVITGNGTIDTASDILVNSLDTNYAQINTLNINGNYTFPSVDGSANYVLKTDGAGNVSWQTDTDTSVNAGIGLTKTGNTIDLDTAQSFGTVDVDSLSVNSAYTFPNIDGSTDYVLKTDGAGNVSWQPDIDTTVSAGTGLTKTGNTISILSSQSFGTVDIDSLSINSAYTLPSVDGSADYVLKTDGAGNVSWTVDSGGISELVQDTSPQLGGTLDLNNYAITGTGEIDIAGNISADLFVGTLEGPVHFEAQATTNILAGEVVYVSGLSGNNPLVSKARANSSSTMPAFGIAGENININNIGNIVTFGSQTGLDVLNFGETGISFSLGDTVYVSQSQAGKITNVPPSGESNFIQNIGKIERATPTSNMTIKVGGAGRTNATPALNNGRIFIGDVSNNAVTTTLQTQVEAYSINNLVEDTSPQLGGDLDANGNNIVMGVNTITDPRVGQWNTAYSWGDHSLEGYLTIDTTVNAGVGLTKTGNTVDLNSSQNFNTVDIDSLTINSAYTLPSVDGTTGYYLATDGAGNALWVEQDSFSAGSNIVITGDGTIDTASDILVNSIDSNYAQINTLNINANYTLPSVDGSADYVLKTNGSGAVSWQPDTDTTVSAGTGLTKTANTISILSSQSFGTVDIDSLSINSSYTLPSLDGSTDYILKTDGAGNVSWTVDSGGISNVIEDTTPQLGGNLDLNARSITGLGTINITGNILGSSLTASDDLITQGGIHEKFSLVTFTLGTSVVTHNTSNGHIFYHSNPASNFTANFTNVDLQSGYGTAFTIIINQGSTGFIPSGVQINSSAQTISWQGNVIPSGSSNRTDVVNFSVLYDGVNYIVLGQLVDF